MRLPAILGAVEGVLLAVVGVVALSPLLLERVSVFTAEGGPAQVVIQMSPQFLTVVSIAGSAVFGAITAYLARVAIPLLRPELVVRGGPLAAASLGGVLGAILGVLAAFVGTAVLGEQTEAGLVVPFFPALLLLTLAGAAFGAVTAVAVYAFSEPELEGEEAEELRVVRRRLIGAVGIPVMGMAGMALVVLSLAFLFLRFHSMAPLLGLVVAGGVLGFASLVALRPRERIPVTEILMALAAVGILVSVIVVAASLTEEGGEGETVTETTVP
jgi:MFS family permease